MFIMLNDGGPLIIQGDLSAERILTQRVFLLEILSSGVSVSLLNGAEFRDSKVRCLVFLFPHSQPLHNRSCRLSMNRKSMTMVNCLQHQCVPPFLLLERLWIFRKPILDSKFKYPHSLQPPHPHPVTNG